MSTEQEELENILIGVVQRQFNNRLMDVIQQLAYIGTMSGITASEEQQEKYTYLTQDTWKPEDSGYSKEALAKYITNHEALLLKLEEAVKIVSHNTFN